MKKQGIYILTCRVNGKQYVGQSTDLEKRWASHFSLAGGANAIYNAIKKHGKHNFDVELIPYPGISIDALNAVEEWKIKQLDTLKPNGYNLQEGGKNGKASQATRLKQSQAGRGRKKSKTHKQNIAEAHRKRFQDPKEREKLKGEKNPNYGKGKLASHTDEVFALKAAGWIQIDIAKKFGVSPATVSLLIKRRLEAQRPDTSNATQLTLF